MRKLLFALGTLILVTTGCGKGDAQKCDQGCRNFAELNYWVEADKEIAKAPADQREALRKAKLVEYAAKLESGLDLCVSKCQSANNEEQINCMTEAKTVQAMKECAEHEEAP